MNMLASRSLSQDQDFLSTMSAAKQGFVAIVSDDAATIAGLTPSSNSWS